MMSPEDRLEAFLDDSIREYGHEAYSSTLVDSVDGDGSRRLHAVRIRAGSQDKYLIVRVPKNKAESVDAIRASCASRIRLWMARQRLVSPSVGK